MWHDYLRLWRSADLHILSSRFRLDGSLLDYPCRSLSFQPQVDVLDVAALMEYHGPVWIIVTDRRIDIEAIGKFRVDSNLITRFQLISEVHLNAFWVNYHKVLETCATSRRSHPSDLSEPMLLFNHVNHTGSIFIHSLCSSVIKCFVFNNNQPRS